MHEGALARRLAPSHGCLDLKRTRRFVMTDSKEISKTLDLTHLREGIEGLDRELLDLLRRRMGFSDEVADAKLQAASPFRDRPREEQVLQRVRHLAAEFELDPRQIERLYRVILDMSVAHQQAYVRGARGAAAARRLPGRRGRHTATSRRSAATPGRAGGVLLTGYETFRGRRRRGARRRRVDVALPADRELDRGQHQRDLRPARRRPPHHHRRGGRASVEHCLLGIARHAARGSARGALAPAGAARSASLPARACRGSSRRPEFDTAGDGAQGRARAATDAGPRSRARPRRRVYGLEVLRARHPDRGRATRPASSRWRARRCRAHRTSACKTSLLVVVRDEPGALGEVLVELARRGAQSDQARVAPDPERSRGGTASISTSTATPRANPWRERWWRSRHGQRLCGCWGATRRRGRGDGRASVWEPKTTETAMPCS